MSGEWSEKTIDYLLSCLEIAKNLDIEDDSLKHNSPFPEIGPIEIYRHMNAGPSVEFKPGCWDTLYQNIDNLLEFTGNLSAAIAKKRYSGELHAKHLFNDSAMSYSADLKMNSSPYYIFKMNESGIVIHDEKGAYILQDALNSIKKYID
ncbi:hypothetical protein GQ472_03920 [archaeon]|nr:hypothetical protein [archaeon]